MVDYPNSSVTGVVAGKICIFESTPRGLVGGSFDPVVGLYEGTATNLAGLLDTKPVVVASLLGSSAVGNGVDLYVNGVHCYLSGVDLATARQEFEPAVCGLLVHRVPLIRIHRLSDTIRYPLTQYFYPVLKRNSESLQNVIESVFTRYNV